MYAIIKSGGKQYRVEKDGVVTVDLVHQDEGSDFVSDQVLFIKTGENEYKIGNPFVDGAKVSGKILNHEKGKKVVIFKKKRRKGYQKKAGHRQNYTKVQITDIQC